jgi:phospholipase C
MNYDENKHPLNDMFAIENSPYGVGYFTRDDIPWHYALADA